MVAVTGTNGKTTVTGLIGDILAAAGHRVVTAGNIGLPALSDWDGATTAVVLEVSSFQLAATVDFHPRVAVWLNFAPDHLDWHPDLHDYARAKARIWHNQDSADTVVVPAGDALIGELVAEAAANVTTFAPADGIESAMASWSVADGWLRGPDGALCAVADLPRALPHDLANALAAAAATSALGVASGVIADVLRAAAPGRHRVELVATKDGVAFVNDSKATNPHAAAAAVRGFTSVVLIAGGRNKGLDLAGLRLPSVRAVVAIGESAADVKSVFGESTPVEIAHSMDEAVTRAAALARPGDTVLLAPGCASFDWYGGYAERGDDFTRAVTELVEATT